MHSRGGRLGARDRSTRHRSATRRSNTPPARSRCSRTCTSFLREAGSRGRTVRSGRARTGLRRQRCSPSRGSVDELAEQLRHTMTEAVRRQLVSDVPLGAFLSGGIDSSIIVAAMKEVSSTPPMTFSVGFDDSTYSELPYAALVAKHCQTQHHRRTAAAELSRDAARRHQPARSADSRLLRVPYAARVAHGAQTRDGRARRGWRRRTVRRLRHVCCRSLRLRSRSIACRVRCERPSSVSRVSCRSARASAASAIRCVDSSKAPLYPCRGSTCDGRCSCRMKRARGSIGPLSGRRLATAQAKSCRRCSEVQHRIG